MSSLVTHFFLVVEFVVSSQTGQEELVAILNLEWDTVHHQRRALGDQFLYTWRLEEGGMAGWGGEGGGVRRDGRMGRRRRGSEEGCGHM